MKRLHVCLTVLFTVLFLMLLGGTALADTNSEFEDYFTVEYRSGGASITGYDFGDEVIPGVVIVPEKCGGRITTSIGAEAFKNMDGITAVYLPSTIKEIGASAFSGCTSLTFISLPDGLSRIGANAFENCDLQNPYLPDSLTDIGADAFLGGAIWETLILPTNLSRIGDEAFYGCRITNLKINGKVKTVPFRAFADCGLELIDVLDCSYMKTIASYAFADNAYLDYVSLPRQLTKVEDHAFAGCGLENFHIPESVKTIGEFYDEDAVLSDFTLHVRKKSAGATFAANSGAAYDYDYTKAQKARVREHSLDYLTAEEYIENGEHYADALPYLKRAAEAGEAAAQSTLADCYYEGYAVDKDFKEALYWARESADQGYPWAQAMLGGMYRQGRGVQKNYEEAVFWYGLAAEQGNRSGLINMGYCYQKGLGVDTDYEMAEAYYRMAKAVGEKNASKRLDELHKLMKKK